MKTLPKFVVSIFIGSALTYLLFWFGTIPRNEPSSISLLLHLPFIILTSVITKDRTVGEFVYFGLQIALYGGISYFVISLFIRKKIDRNNIAIIALGSNLGDSRRVVSDAMARLQQFSDEPILKSSLWQTTPVDCPPDSPKFVNAIVAFVPRKGETPESLLKKLRELEKEFGRQPKKILNEPRALDLDLIVFGNEIRNTLELILPHPRAHLRRFVLQPLSEIAPDLILPGQVNTVMKLLANLPDDETVTRLQ